MVVPNPKADGERFGEEALELLITHLTHSRHSIYYGYNNDKRLLYTQERT